MVRSARCKFSDISHISASILSMYEDQAFVPKRGITAEQARRLIEGHLATIARRSSSIAEAAGGRDRTGCHGCNPCYAPRGHRAGRQPTSRQPFQRQEKIFAQSD